MVKHLRFTIWYFLYALHVLLIYILIYDPSSFSHSLSFTLYIIWIALSVLSLIYETYVYLHLLLCFSGTSAYIRTYIMCMMYQVSGENHIVDLAIHLPFPFVLIVGLHQPLVVLAYVNWVPLGGHSMVADDDSFPVWWWWWTLPILPAPLRHTSPIRARSLMADNGWCAHDADL